MVKKGSSTNKKIDNLAKEMRRGFVKLDKKIGSLDTKIDSKIDDLAAMTIRGFNDVHKRMDKMETGLEKRLVKRMDEGFEKVDSKIDGLHRRIDDAIDRDVALEVRIAKVEKVVFPK